MLFPDNLIFRLDSEFYNSKAISIDSKLKEMTHFCLKQDEVVSGPFGSALKSDAYLTEGDIPFVRIENIRGGFDINMDNIIYISSQDNNRIKNSQLHVDDIVLSKVGNSIGFFARVDESVGVCNISENNIGIKLAKYSTIEKHYILTYLNCKHAQMLVLRRTSGNAQPKLNVGDLCHIPIPQFTNRFYESISKTILQSKSLVLQSQKLYSSAELILKNEFHIEQNNAPTAIKSLSESFKKTGRLDAEYYQKKYERYSKSLHKRFLKVFDAMLAFCARALNAMKASCLNPQFGAEHKLLSQMPITNFLQSIEDGEEMTLADKEKAYLWFISFVYRLRNALFHEIIDPLNDEWQVIFKNSYHVLKQVVDQNIWRLKQLKLLPLASQAAAENDYNREPPPDIDWPTDEEAKFTWFHSEMLKLNKEGARVLLKGKIDFAEHHYETECTVRWNESLSETAIKNASITRVVESQEKELAAAI